MSLVAEGREVKVQGDANSIAAVTSCAMFKNWWEKTKEKVLSLKIAHIEYSGMAAANVKHATGVPMLIWLVVSYRGMPVPRNVLLRGTVHMVLPILEEKNTGSFYVVASSTPAVPVGDMNYLEFPMGGWDPDGQFIGSSAQSLKQIGLTKITTSTVREASLLHNAPSATDETTHLHIYRHEVTSDWLKAATQKLQSSPSLASLAIINAEDAWRTLTDARSLAALSRANI
eukprot:TRINITY_DN31327_c0_g1_i1.p1 TRINITY_DN31327_c0_g1~~TRINITY_DN31327_c0_g1_i1.p1  ORF type:complete len:251 (+),score=37.03 TRINITY_DN31327_c0_g1_i1:68-754(+)